MKTICVFCGSAPGNSPTYLEAARDAGKVLAEANFQIVYGGAKSGLMGALATSALENNGRVIGILPSFLRDREVAHPNLTDLEIVPTMHKRKERMNELSDGFLVLPGGIGTLDELFEIFTWQNLGIHQKPIGILNIDNYYNSLLEFLQNTVDRGFFSKVKFDRLLIHNNLKTLLEYMKKIE